MIVKPDSDRSTSSKDLDPTTGSRSDQISALAMLLGFNLLFSFMMLESVNDPFTDMKDFPFPCEPCGWAYESKETYALRGLVEGLVGISVMIVAFRYRYRWWTWLLLTVPVLAMWALNMKDIWGT